VAEALRRFKYGDRSDLARPLGGLLRRGIEGNAPGSVDAVVPVPLHRRRLVERGYNQSALLAREVSDALRIPVLHALSRGRDTPQQALLDAVARRENVRDAFALARGQNVHGRRVLLVDDVATTGATLGECRRVLLEGGAAAVIAAVVAIAER
jgi:ComF family protein